MAILAATNLYPGVNAHLNSFLQVSGGLWQSFHKDYITYLRAEIDAHLPPGYFTLSENALQISEFDAGSGDTRRSISIADVSIVRPLSGSAQDEHAAPVLTVPRILDLTATLEEAETLTGLVIYQVREMSGIGKPIARLEVLSPANKANGSHHEQYMVKRWATLRAGVRLIEIDLLHHSAPILSKIAPYGKRAPDAVPYIILMNNPQPTFESGKVAIYPIGVVQPFPLIHIPLVGNDSVEVDFGTAYNRLFASSIFFRSQVDYAADPPAFDRYTPADQAAIRAHLDAIRAQQGAT
jgi:hypothetical protein